jgi:hypothetical protein
MVSTKQRLFGVSFRPGLSRRHARDTLTVSDGYAIFTDLRGPVAPGGTARLSSQTARLEGRFQGAHFQGLLQYYERGSDRLGCGYTLKLERTS